MGIYYFFFNKKEPVNGYSIILFSNLGVTFSLYSSNHPLLSLFSRKTDFNHREPSLIAKNFVGLCEMASPLYLMASQTMEPVLSGAGGFRVGEASRCVSGI